jgi:hypothetical protein
VVVAQPITLQAEGQADQAVAVLMSFILQLTQPRCIPVKVRLVKVTLADSPQALAHLPQEVVALGQQV